MKCVDTTMIVYLAALILGAAYVLLVRWMQSRAAGSFPSMETRRVNRGVALATKDRSDDDGYSLHWAMKNQGENQWDI